jgi:uncharacterized protein
MYWHIILTELCNSKCRYCYEKSMQEFDNGLEKKFKFDFNVPCDTEVDIQKLKGFILKDKNPVIIFYGGEPLLKIDKIKEIINAFENTSVRFCMQTNAKLIHKLPKKYMNKFSKILVSLDGDKKRTDYNRGQGTYDKVIENLKLIRKNNFKGEIVARMTISFPDIFEQVKHLLEIEEIDSVHWQLDAGFYKTDFNKEKFTQFVKQYNQSITGLINFWIKNIKKAKVLKLYPFLGIMQSLLDKKPTKLRCGSGHAGYTLTTKGDITTCPIMNNITNFYVGNLNSNPKELREISVSGKCKTCKYLNLCGGRCLYANKAQLWPEIGQELICDTVKHLINELKKILPEIIKLINQNIIKESDFEYEKYFGPEIIP